MKAILLSVVALAALSLTSCQTTSAPDPFDQAIGEAMKAMFQPQQGGAK